MSARRDFSQRPAPTAVCQWPGCRRHAAVINFALGPVCFHHGRQIVQARHASKERSMRKVVYSTGPVADTLKRELQTHS